MFKLFHPCSTTSQITPYSADAKYAVESQRHEDLEDDPHLPKDLKLKPQLNFNDDGSKVNSSYRKYQNKHSAQKQTEENSQTILEKDMFLFSSELHWKEGDIYDYQYQLLTCQHQPFLYYECSNANGSLANVKSPLVLVLRSILDNKPIAYNKQSIQSLLFRSIIALNELFKSYEQSSNVLFISSSLSTSELNYFKHFHSFTSIEHTFITADILLAAFLKYYRATMDSKIVLGKKSGVSAENEDDTTLVKEFTKLLSHFNNIIVLANEDSKPSSTIAFSHCLMKCFKVMFILIKQLHLKLATVFEFQAQQPAPSSASPKPNLTSNTSVIHRMFSSTFSPSVERKTKTPGVSQQMKEKEIEELFHLFISFISEVIDLIPILLQNISFIKIHCNEESIQYHLILLQFYEFLELFYSFLLQLEIIFQKKQFKKIMKLFQNKLLSWYTSLLPHSIQEILSEMKRMEQFYYMKSSNLNNQHPVPSTVMKNKENMHYKEDVKLSNLIKYLLNQEKEDERQRRADIFVASGKKEKNETEEHQLLSLQNTITTGNTSLTHASVPTMEFLLSFRFRHLLYGLNKLVYIYQPLCLSPGSSSNPIPTTGLMLNSTSSLHPLSFSNPLLNMQKLNSPNKEQSFLLLNDLLTYLIPQHHAYSDHSYELLRCVPFLAQLMLKLSLSVNKRDPAVKWVYWHLAQKLMKFNENIRTYKNTYLAFNTYENFYSNGPISSRPGEEQYPPISVRSSKDREGASSPQFTTPKRRVSYSNKPARNILSEISDSNNTESPPQLVNPTLMDNRGRVAVPDLANDTPFKDLRSTNDSTPAACKPSSGTEFKVDDLVDGQCLLSNGSKRWFPGKIKEIKEVNGETLYIILFNDGEISPEKRADEIRLTKNRQSRNKSQQSSVANTAVPTPTVSAPASPAQVRKASTENPFATPKMNPSNAPSPAINLIGLSHSGSNTNLSGALSPDLLLSPSSEKAASPAIANRKPMKIPSRDKNIPIPKLEKAQSSLSMSSVKQVDDPVEDDVGGTSDEESEEDRIFEIPSIFDNHRTVNNTGNNKKSVEEMVPRMQFSNLPVTAALPQVNSSPSLSASLLAETTPSENSTILPLTSGRSDNFMIYNTPISGRKYSARGQSFYKQNTPSGGNNSTGFLSGRSHHLTHRSNVLTHRSVGEMEESMNSTNPNSSRSLHHGRRTPITRKRSNTMGDEPQNGTSFHSSRGENGNKTLVSASVNASSMHSISLPHPHHNHSSHSLQNGFTHGQSHPELIRPVSSKAALQGFHMHHPVLASTSGFNSIRSTPIVIQDQYDRVLNNHSPSFENMDLLLEIHTIIVMILLSNCMIGMNELDYNCCFHHPEMTATDENSFNHSNGLTHKLSSKSMDSMESSFQLKSNNSSLPSAYPNSFLQGKEKEKERECYMNSIFLIREYMELTYPTQLNNSPHHQNHQQYGGGNTLLFTCHHQNSVMNALTSYILYLNSFYEMRRLVKLLHPIYFHSKLSSYLTPLNAFEKQYSTDDYEAELNKIGEGAFGTVYRLILSSREEKQIEEEEEKEVEKKENKKKVPSLFKKSSLPFPQQKHQQTQFDTAEFSQYSHCFSCYLRENYPQYNELKSVLSTPSCSSSDYVYCQCWKAQFRPSSPNKRNHRRFQKPQSQKKKVFAIKKVIRERSIHDLSTYYNLYNEILCLEKLSECIGICGIEDYGLSPTAQEYIMILENGFMNILEWRQHYLLYKNNLYSFYTQERLPVNGGVGGLGTNGLFTSDSDSPSMKQRKQQGNNNSAFDNFNLSSPVLNPSLSVKSYQDLLLHYSSQSKTSLEFITEWDLLLLFYLYSEMILILEYIHSQKIIHFDIKLANFILRDNPIYYFQYIAYMHSLNKPSGILFLTDFGEAIYDIHDLYYHSNDQNMKILQKSRGTINIQSPEMLSISESQHSQQQQKLLMKKKLVASLPASNFPSSSSMTEEQKENSIPEVQQQQQQPHHFLQRKPLFLQKQEEIDEFSLSKLESASNNNAAGANEENKKKGPTMTTSATGFKKYQFPLPDYSSDIWSLGCLFIELLTSEMLFFNQSFPELYTKLCLQFPLQSINYIEIFNEFLRKNSEEIKHVTNPSNQSHHRPSFSNNLTNGGHRSLEKGTIFEDDKENSISITQGNSSNHYNNTNNNNSAHSSEGSSASNHIALFPKEEMNYLLSLMLRQIPQERISLKEISSKMREIIDKYSHLTIIKVQNSEKQHKLKKLNEFYQSTLNSFAFNSTANTNTFTNYGVSNGAGGAMTRENSAVMMNSLGFTAGTVNSVQSPPAPLLNRELSEQQLSYSSFFNNQNNVAIQETDEESKTSTTTNNDPPITIVGGNVNNSNPYGNPQKSFIQPTIHEEQSERTNNNNNNKTKSGSSSLLNYRIVFDAMYLRKLNKQMKTYYSGMNAHNLASSNSGFSSHSSCECIHFSNSIFLINEDLIHHLLHIIPKTTILNQISSSNVGSAEVVQEEEATSSRRVSISHQHPQHPQHQPSKQRSSSTAGALSVNSSAPTFNRQVPPTGGGGGAAAGGQKKFFSFNSSISSVTSPPLSPSSKKCKDERLHYQQQQQQQQQKQSSLPEETRLHRALSNSSFQNPYNLYQEKEDFLQMNLKLIYENHYDQYLYANSPSSSSSFPDGKNQTNLFNFCQASSSDKKNGFIYGKHENNVSTMESRHRKNSINNNNEDESFENNSNDHLLFPNYSYFKSNLLLEDIVQQQYVPLYSLYDQLLAEDEQQERSFVNLSPSSSASFILPYPSLLASPSSASSKIGSSHPNQNSSGAAVTTAFNYAPNNYMENMVSFLLSDLLAHSRYYTKDYSFTIDKEEISNFNYNQSNVNDPHEEKKDQSSSQLIQLVPILCIKFVYEFRIIDELTSSSSSNNNKNDNNDEEKEEEPFIPKVECLKHSKHSNIFIYQISIPITIIRHLHPDSSSDEEENKPDEEEKEENQPIEVTDDDNVNKNEEEKKKFNFRKVHRRHQRRKGFPSDGKTYFSLAISIEEMILIFKEFLLNYFIPSLYNLPPHSSSSAAFQNNNSQSNQQNHVLKPLIFVFGFDKLDEIYLRKNFHFHFPPPQSLSSTQQPASDNHATPVPEGMDLPVDEQDKRNDHHLDANQNEEPSNPQQKQLQQEREELAHYHYECELFLQRLSFQCQQLINSLRLSLSGFLTRYLEEDYSSTSSSSSSSGIDVSSSSSTGSSYRPNQSQGDALQSILQSIITLIRFIPNWEDSYCHMYFLEKFLFHFFQSLLQLEDHSSSSSSKLLIDKNSMMMMNKDGIKQQIKDGLTNIDNSAATNYLLLSPDPSSNGLDWTNRSNLFPNMLKTPTVGPSSFLDQSYNEPVAPAAAAPPPLVRLNTLKSLILSSHHVNQSSTRKSEEFIPSKSAPSSAAVSGGGGGGGGAVGSSSTIERNGLRMISPISSQIILSPPPSAAATSNHNTNHNNNNRLQQLWKLLF